MTFIILDRGFDNVSNLFYYIRTVSRTHIYHSGVPKINFVRNRKISKVASRS